MHDLLAWLNDNHAAVTAVAALVAAIAAMGALLHTLVTARTTHRRLDTLHVQINSRMDQLLAAATQAGILQGRTERPPDQAAESGDRGP